MRRVIVAGWVLTVLVSAPSFVQEGRRISAMASGSTRRDALMDLIVSVLMVDVAMPLGALAMFGYGVVPRRNALITGEPPFQLSWDEAKRKKDAARREQKRQSDL
jgi:hypothetical protein